ncbi:hypothetical protein [Shewanella baltica]|uniref:hypothetical protein n=1 Tax=Shewanella baltica TaxID=62322 RepID=UPI00217F19AD|nr:hypothetical protein [Shewanella baltica]MCS6205346.1 hypothetical protein [Shewanella baltica]
MAITLNDYYSQLLDFVKRLKINGNEDRETLAYYAMFKIMFPDDGKYYKKFSEVVDKKLADNERNTIPEKLLIAKEFETAFNLAEWPSELNQLNYLLSKNDRDHRAFATLAIDIIEMAYKGEIDSVITKVNALPVDYPFYSRLEGQLLLLLFSLKEQEWGLVKSTLALCCVLAQTSATTFAYQTLLGEVVRRKVPDENLPWMMHKPKAIVLDNETFYCMPFMMSSYSVLYQHNVHGREVEMPNIETYSMTAFVPKYRDTYGRTYVSGSSLVAGAMTSTIVNSINAFSAVAQLATQSLMNHLKKGSWEVFVGPGILAELKSSKSTLFPIGTGGYIISRNPECFADWEASIDQRHISSSSIKKYCGVLNFADGEYYEVSSKGLPNELKAILQEIN